MQASSLATAFVLTLLMELGDKTQLVVLGLTARSGRAGPVIAGAAVGLTAVTALGVAAGAFVTRWVSLEWLARGAGTAFVLLGLWTLWSTRPGAADDDEDEEKEALEAAERARGRSDLGLFWLACGLLAAAEMGDKTQLTAVGLVARSQQPLAVFLGAAGALVLLAAVAGLAGRALATRFSPRLLNRVAGALFVGLGVLTLIQAGRPG